MDKISLKNINKMAFPLLINYFSFSLIGLIDQAMLGHVSLFAYGAAGLVVNTINSITGLFSGIAVFFNIIGSGKYSQKKYRQLAEYFYISLFCSAIIGLFISVILLIIRYPVLSGFFGLHDMILKEALDYYSFYVFTIILNLIIFCFNSYYKINGRTKWILITSLTSNIINIILDYIFIFGKFGFPVLGAKGAAIASLISLLGAIIIYIILIGKEKIPKTFKIKFLIIKKIAKDSLALMGQELLEGTLLVLVINAIISRIGELEIGIYNLTSYIFSLILLPAHAYGTIALTLVSRTHEHPKTVYKLINRYSHFIVIGIYCFFSIIYFFLNKTIPYFITNDKNLIQNSADYIPLLILIYFLQIPQHLYKYMLQGLGKSKFVFLVNLIINCLIIICWVLFYNFANLNLTQFYIIFALNSLLIVIFFHFYFTKVLNQTIDNVKND